MSLPGDHRPPPPTRPEYPPFIRGGQKYTPRWATRKVGSVAYDVTYDQWWICTQEHVGLTLSVEDATGKDDEGKTPKELGLDPNFPQIGLVPPYMQLIPQWVTDAGITASAFGFALAPLLPKG